jgi:hypothetical protein
MDIVNMNRGKCNVLWDTEPELYFTHQQNYCAVLILWFVYMSFMLQILLCHLSHCHHLITALYYSQIKISSTVLANFNCS